MISGFPIEVYIYVSIGIAAFISVHFIILLLFQKLILIKKG